MILQKLKPNELIIMQYTEEEPEKGESDKYAGLGIGVAGLLAENLACHPFIILRRQCQVVTIMFMKKHFILHLERQNQSILKQFSVTWRVVECTQLHSPWCQSLSTCTG